MNVAHRPKYKPKLSIADPSGYAVKAWVWGRSLTGIVGAKVCLVWVSYIVW